MYRFIWKDHKGSKISIACTQKQCEKFIDRCIEKGLEVVDFYEEGVEDVFGMAKI
jgi:hypothetical protein